MAAAISQFVKNFHIFNKKMNSVTGMGLFLRSKKKSIFGHNPSTFDFCDAIGRNLRSATSISYHGI